MSSTTLQAEGLEGIFQRIAALPPDAIAKLFPNIRALKGVLPALKNMTGFADDMAVMTQRAGATEIAYQKMSQTLATQLARIKQAGLVVLSVVGEALAPALKTTSRILLNIADHISAWAKQNKGLM